jgi:LysR family nod box-dependent transcriptional activator
MTQPAVSGALARLRQQFDDPILVRNGRIFELTEKAEAIAPMVEDAMIEITRVLDLSPTFDPETSTRTFFISASDYVLAQMTGVLLDLLADQAPGIHVEFDSLPVDAVVSPNDLLRRDVIIVGTGRGVPGKKQSLFSDRFVCVVDANNPRINEGKLTIDDLQEMRHVRSNFGESIHTHVDDMFTSAGLVPRVAVSVQGFLPVPFVVSGTGFVGYVPERLALAYQDHLGLAIVETPLSPPTLVEAAHWHPSKTNDPAIKWLVALLRRAAELVEFAGDED